MKILHYVDENRLAWGETWIRLIKELKLKGVEGHVVCKSGGTLSRRLAEEGLSFETCDIPVQLLPFTARKLKSIIAASRPDIIHTRLSSAALTGGFWGRKMGIPVIHTIDKYPKAYYYKNGTLLIPCSCAVRDHMLSVGFTEDKMQVVYNPIDISKYIRDGDARTQKRRELKAGDRTVIMSAGRFVNWKGFEFALEAYGKILKSVPYMRESTLFLLVGSGPKEVEYLDLAVRLGMEENVIFHSFVQDIRPWLWAADIFVQPSQTPEGFSLMLLEAMASSLPVITTNIGGSLDIIEDGKNGWLTKTGESDHIAQILTEILTDKEKRESASVNAVRTAWRYNVSEIADEMKDIYEKVANANG